MKGEELIFSIIMSFTAAVPLFSFRSATLSLLFLSQGSSMLELSCCYCCFHQLRWNILYSVEVIQPGRPKAWCLLPHPEFRAGKIEFPRDPDSEDHEPISPTTTVHLPPGPKSTTVHNISYMYWALNLWATYSPKKSKSYIILTIAPWVIADG